VFIVYCFHPGYIYFLAAGIIVTRSSYVRGNQAKGLLHTRTRAIVQKGIEVLSVQTSISLQQ
jgi:hypothetical protein